MNSKIQLIKKRSHRCEKCENTVWMDKPIALERHHIDGDTKNNIDTNLQLLCPNCHAMTPNYRGKNKKSHPPRKSDADIAAVIPKCQSIKEALRVLKMTGFGQSYTRIKKVMQKYSLTLAPRQMSEKEVERALSQRRVQRPSKEELRSLVWDKPATEIAKQLGVSDKAIENWCKFYDIPKPPRGYWSKMVPAAKLEFA